MIVIVMLLRGLESAARRALDADAAALPVMPFLVA